MRTAAVTILALAASQARHRVPYAAYVLFAISQTLCFPWFHAILGFVYQHAFII